MRRSLERRKPGSRGGVAALALLVALGACDHHGDAPATPPEAAQPTPPKPKPTPVAAAPEPEPDSSEPEPPRRAPEPLAEDEKDDQPATSSRIIIDDLNDLGPAGPASAFAGGVVMVTRSNELEVLKLLAPLSKSKKPAPGRIQATSRTPDEFWPLARGPALSATHAYWISKGRLLRRALGGGALEVLTSDARDGTRVAVAGSPDAVAYITQPSGKHESIARLRLADGKLLDLTPEGAAASSVALASIGDDLVASYIDGRSGMTPVHARRFRSKTGKLDPDVVVWVTGATQGLTEITSVGTQAGSWLMLPVERDASHFGLAALAVDKDPKMDPPLRWRTYENGLDRAPTAAAKLCGAPMTVYARPVDASPGARQELMLSSLTLDATASSEQLASARGFADVSLSALPAGALLAYVADRHTWARVLRCKPAP